jgi:hypothetical protein
MAVISDEFMRDMLSRTRAYSAVLLRRTSKRDAPDADRIVWEHGRRNFALRAEGSLSIVCPVTTAGDLSGIGIFNRSVEEVHCIMDEDPAVQAGIFTYEVFPVRSFPGDALPS